MATLRSPDLDDPVRIRSADAELLSLALIDARNLTLRWLEVFECRGLLDRPCGHPRTPLWLVGHAAWYQEWWITRHVQRGRGEDCDAAAPRLAAIEPACDGWFAGAGPGAGELPHVRQWLADSLDTTLELLSAAGRDDDALHFFRAALLHEDRLGQALAECAAFARLTPTPDPPPPWVPLAARVDREALYLPEATIELGSRQGGYVPDNERWAEPLRVPDFEIDAQPVNWERWIEFAEDGGYDRPELWTDEGRAWLQREARRAPRDVEQLRGGVLVHRLGRLQRAPLGQPAMHLSRHEAEAWCRWAGRRLPTELEWEAAAIGAARRGFVWGDVFEWVAGSARPWTGWAPTPGTLDAMPPPRSQGVLRGASFMTPRRWRHPKARRFAAPATDQPLCGFRSCAP